MPGATHLSYTVFKEHNHSHAQITVFDERDEGFVVRFLHVDAVDG